MLGVLLYIFGLLLLAGLPVAFAMGLSSLAALFSFGQIPLTLIPQRIIVALDSFSLMAVPLFILAGEIMNIGGLTHRIIAFANCLVGHIRGGLAHVGVVASMIFAGISGSSTADASALGSVLIPAMVDEGYDADLAISVTASAATIGPIIPPSIIMIIYGSMTNLSIGALFLSGLIPGILIGLALMITAYFFAVKRNYPAKTRATWAELKKVSLQAIPALIAPVIIIGGITGGVFTATEAGVIAVIYALGVGCFYHEITISKLYQSTYKSALATSVILLIIACASVFGWILAHEQFPQTCVGFLTTLSSNPIVILLLVVVFLLVIGLFIEGMASLIILVPVLAPLAAVYGYNPIHLAMIVALAISIGAITPPVGILLYITSAVGKVSLSVASKTIWAFTLAMLVVLLMVVFYPPLATYLPSILIK